MKKIKLDHELAQAVVRGEKTSTWRLYDDKNLTVNDEIAVIDKVDPEKPATWRLIGAARINRIIEKRLGDIQPEDYEGHGSYEEPRERLQTFQRYYGDRVTWDTPVKMVYFDFVPGAPIDVHMSENTDMQGGEEGVLEATSVVGRPPLIGEKVTLYADGGSRGNPGPSASGFVIIDKSGEVLVDKGIYLGVTTNNQAEYHGLKVGLEEARAMGAREVDVRLDSLLVVNQMNGTFKVKNRDLWPVHEAVKRLVGSFRKVTFTHVPREMNRLADAAVNRVLDEVQSSRSSRMDSV